VRGHEAGHFVRSVANYDGAIQHFVNHHGAAGQGVPPACLFDLKDPIVQHYRVVLVDAAKAKSLRRVGTNAVPFCAAGMANRELNSAMYCSRRN